MVVEHRQMSWLLYGWFTGLMCLGSVFGAVTWAAWMQSLVAEFNIYAPGRSLAQQESFHAQGQYWFVAFYVTYAIEFMCLSVAKLLVLDRMADFAAAKSDGMRRRLAAGGRVVMAAVVVGNVVGFVANVAAAVFAKEIGDLHSAAAAAFASNNASMGHNFKGLALAKSNVKLETLSVQQFCEVAVLLITIIAFAVVGIACGRRVSSALRDMNDELVEAAGRHMRRQIVGTAAFVFVTFLLRAVFSTMNAVSRVLQNEGAACGATANGFCDSACYNVWWLTLIWITFTPEFQLSVVFISSPLALLVALWGMTSARTLQIMNYSRRKMALIGDSAVLRTR